MEFGGYDWRVLEVSEGKALLLSEYVLEHRAYHGVWRDDWSRDANFAALSTTWADCDLRTYLNGEFRDRFSEGERARIADTYLINDDNPWLWSDVGATHTPGGADTTDQIFLLSVEEMLRYFGDSGQFASQSPDQDAINDQFNEARIAYALAETPWGDPAGTALWWWLRLPGYESYAAAYVNEYGSIWVSGSDVDAYRGGVRPALWVYLE